MSESPTFSWDSKTQQYRYTSGDKKGQFVAQSVVSPYLLEKYIDARKESLVRVTKTLLKKDIGVGTWESAISKELKEAHLVAYSLGKGGYKKLSSRDYGLIGSKLKGEYQYLRGFSEDILAGNLSEGQILNRLQMYVDSLHSTYEKARAESHRVAGFTWEKWNRIPGDSCEGCITQGSRGWVPLGSLPMIGSQTCLSRCRCALSYQKGSTRPQEGLNKKIRQDLNLQQ